MVGSDAVVVWQARPTARAVVSELLLSLAVVGVFVAVARLLPKADPWSALPFGAAVVIGAARDVATTVRGRVVLRPDGIEVRRLLTRHYPWASLRSLTVEEDGRIEITPKGWVRKLPIPRSEVPEAFATLTRWRDAALGPR